MKRFVLLLFSCICFSGCAFRINKDNPDLYQEAINKMKIKKNESSSNSKEIQDSSDTKESKTYSYKEKLTNGNDYHLYTFTSSSNKTTYTIRRTDLSGKSVVSIYDTVPFETVSIDSDENTIYIGANGNTENTASITTSHSKTIYIEVTPKDSYDSNAGQYSLQISTSTGEEIEISVFKADNSEKSELENSTYEVKQDDTTNNSEAESEIKIRSDSVTATLSKGKDCHIYYFETSDKKSEYKISRTDYDSDYSDVVISDDYAFYNILKTLSGFSSTKDYSLETDSKKKIYIKIYPSSNSDYNAGEYKLEVSGKTNKEIDIQEYKNTIDSTLIKSDSVTATLSKGKDCHIYYFETSDKKSEYKISRTDYDSDYSDVVISDDYAFYNILKTLSGFSSTKDYSLETDSKKKIYIKIYPSSNSDYNAGEYKLEVSGKTNKEINLTKYY